MMYAYDEIYLPQARVSLGNMLDFAVNSLGRDLRDFWNEFLVSEVSSRFARGESAIVAGKSGAELALLVLGADDEAREILMVREGKSPEYWAGWALAYFQWSSNVSFEAIDEAVPIENIVSMYFPYHEMDIRQFCDRMSDLMAADRKETKLKARRRLLGLTQKELAEETGIPLRSVQQYEQGQKSLGGARSEYIVAFSRALYCRPEDLI